jgi:hypothetical protein
VHDISNGIRRYLFGRIANPACFVRAHSESRASSKPQTPATGPTILELHAIARR